MNPSQTAIYIFTRYAVFSYSTPNDTLTTLYSYEDGLLPYNASGWTATSGPNDLIWIANDDHMYPFSSTTDKFLNCRAHTNGQQFVSLLPVDKYVLRLGGIDLMDDSYITADISTMHRNHGIHSIHIIRTIMSILITATITTITTIITTLPIITRKQRQRYANNSLRKHQDEYGAHPPHSNQHINHTIHHSQHIPHNQHIPHTHNRHNHHKPHTQPPHHHPHGPRSATPQNHHLNHTHTHNAHHSHCHAHNTHSHNAHLISCQRSIYRTDWRLNLPRR
eukprot:217692_1